MSKCPIHGLPFDVPTDCDRCHGEGVTEDDQEFGCSPPFIDCWECAGTGSGRPECKLCLLEDDED